MYESPTTSLVSISDTLSYYRLAIDGHDTTDRNVEYGSANFNNQLVRAFKNLGKSESGDNYMIQNLQTKFDNTGVSKCMIPVTVVNSDKTQLLQVTLHNSLEMTEKLVIYGNKYKELFNYKVRKF